jgi:GNAT superfamily N-acetyltransferase
VYGQTKGSLGLSLPEVLSERHDISSFDCGTPELTDWLQRYALQSATSTRTLIIHRSNLVLGYYSLCASSVELKNAPARVAKGQARYPLPVVLLARLAVDKTLQRQGVGSSLLQDAVKRYLLIVENLGSRALLVHAKDETAAQFYRKWGFEPSPITPLHMYLLSKDARKTLSMS